LLFSLRIAHAEKKKKIHYRKIYFSENGGIQTNVGGEEELPFLKL
jgi:hypothetical protein